MGPDDLKVPSNLKHLVILQQLLTAHLASCSILHELSQLLRNSWCLTCPRSSPPTDHLCHPLAPSRQPKHADGKNQTCPMENDVRNRIGESPLGHSSWHVRGGTGLQRDTPDPSAAGELRDVCPEPPPGRNTAACWAIPAASPHAGWPGLGLGPGLPLSGSCSDPSPGNEALSPALQLPFCAPM